LGKKLSPTTKKGMGGTPFRGLLETKDEGRTSMGGEKPPKCWLGKRNKVRPKGERTFFSFEGEKRPPKDGRSDRRISYRKENMTRKGKRGMEPHKRGG